MYRLIIHLVKVRGLLFSVILLSIYLFGVTPALAGITITRGESATIHWDVQGDPYCQPGFQVPEYPDIGDGVYSAWMGSNKTGVGSKTFSSFWGDSGKAFPQTYTFKCTSANAEDTDAITINGCSVGTTWDNSTHTCKIPPAESGSNSGTECGVAAGVRLA